MKRALRYIMVAVAMTALAAACTKEEIKDDTDSGQEQEVVPEGFVSKTFTARISELTRASFTGSRVNWEETDKIAVYDGSCKNEFSVQNIDNGLATFKGFVTEGSEEFYAVFPYSAASETLPTAEGEISFSVPSEQTAGEATYDADAIVSVAKADDVAHFQFRNVVSMVRLHVPDGAVSVEFKPNGSEKLSGDCTVAIGEAAEGATEASVVLKSDTGEAFTAGDFWIAVAPATLADGYTVSYSSGAQTADVRSSDVIDLVRNASLDITSGTSVVKWPKTSVRTADELLAFAEDAANYTAEDLVTIEADIDMSGKTWTPFVLECTLDGKDHRIYNISVSSSTTANFITQVKGTLKNVVFGSSDGAAYDGNSVISLTDAGQNAGVVGNNNGTIENVISFVNVDANVTGAPASDQVRVGGVAAANYGVIAGCENKGTIKAAGNTGKMIFAGGVVGWSSSSSDRIENCSNSGEIIVDGPSVQSAAGIAGMYQGGNLLSCNNSGKITVKNSSKRNSYFGGIAGFVQIYAAGGAKIENCRNTGEFDLDNTTVFGAGGIAGVIHRAATAQVTISGCENSADIFMSKQHTAENVNLGGIAGMCDALNTNPFAGTNIITACTNSGKVYYKESRSLSSIDGKLSTAGGIIGWTNNKIEISGCSNSGDISSDKISLDYLGGIAGYVNSGTTISDCTNTADVTLDLGTSRTYSGGNRPGAGGIACYTGGTVTIKGSKNSGAVSITISKSDQCAAGGVVATTEGTLTLTGNTNSGSVTSTSKNPDKAAGGILGRAMRTVTMTGNTNTGDVTAIGANGYDHDNVMAGGLIGLIDQGAANVPTVVTVTGDVADCAVKSSVGRAGLLFAIMNHVASGSYQPKATFTDCKIGGSVEGKVKDGFETSGPVTVSEANMDSYSYSYKGANANLAITGLSFAD